MEKTEKVIIATYLISKKADFEAAANFVHAIEQGIELGEEDAIQMRESLLRRIELEDIPGEYGAFIRIVKTTGDLVAATERLDRAVGGFQEANRLLRSNPQSELAAKIVVRQAIKAISDGLGRETFERPG